MKISKYYAIALLAFTGCAVLKNNKSAGNDFFGYEREQIMSKGPNQPMRIFKIDNYEDSLLLRKPSEKVSANSKDNVLKHFIDRLYSTVRDSLSMGVGIAAPQVGILKQVIWVQRFDKKGFPFEYYINPKIISYSEATQDCREGCLSIPNLLDTTRIRAKQIKIRYDKFEQTGMIETIDGFTAVIFQHEIDHLDGILFIDHLEKEVTKSN